MSGQADGAVAAADGESPMCVRPTLEGAAAFRP